MSSFTHSRLRRVILTGMLVLGGLPFAARGAEVAPMGRGARHHFAPVPDVAAPSDGLERSLLTAVEEVARNERLDPPQHDPRLAMMAYTLARTLEPHEVPGVELQEFLLSHYGMGEVAPEILMKHVTATDRAIREQIARELPRLLRRGYARVGIGVHRQWLTKSVVIALQRVDLEMLPVPRQLEPGGSAMVGGRLLNGVRSPRVLVAPPSGPVVDLPVRGDRENFQTIFRCDGQVGRHQLEVMGTGPRGKTVLANFPVYCGVTPPVTFGGGMIERPETTDPARAEELMLSRVNQDRAKVGLRPLTWDPELARVARAHSQEMASRQVVAHSSPTTGDAADRVRRAGLTILEIAENVGQAKSIADVQRSFMTSPGHRANVLDPRARRFGAGVAVRTGGKTPALYVTQLFVP